MSTHVLDVAAFKLKFPEFQPQPQANIQACWDLATQYIDPNDGCVLSGTTLQAVLDLLTAHIGKLNLMATAGDAGGVVQAATEGSVSVTLVAPPVENQWQWWLAKTAYGQQVWALLSLKAAIAPFVGGSLERASFRKAGGVW